MANNKSQQEQEYQELLKVSQSLLGSITQSMDNLSDATDKRNKALSNDISLTKDAISNLKTWEDYEAAINTLREQRVNISKKDYGINNKFKEAAIRMNASAESTLQTTLDNREVLDNVSQGVDGVTESFKEMGDNIMGSIRKIPLIGKSLANTFDPFYKKFENELDTLNADFKQEFTKSFVDAKINGESFFKSFQSGMKGGMNAIKSFATRIGFVGIAVAAFVGGLILGMPAFRALEKAARSFRDETGLLVSQTGEMTQNIQSALVSTLQLGASAEDVSKAASAFVNEFDKLEQPSEAVLTSMVTLNKNFGIGVEEASKLNKVFQNIGGLSAEQSQLLIGQTAEMAKMAGVAPQQVIKDMADNAGEAYKFFGGMPEELAKAAVSAAKMGTSIKEAANVANSLLDYESSVTKELEASAILGTNLNLSRARQLAATNDILGAQQAVLDEVSTLGDLTRLNVYEQQALVEATGMELESLVNQQRIRERFGKLQGEQLEAAMSLVNAGVDITNATEDDLIAQQKRLASQKELQSITENISNQFNALKTALSAAFMPLVTFVMPIVSDIITALNVFLMPLLKGIGAFLGIAGGILSTIYNVFRAILGPVFKFIGAIAEGFVTPLMKAKELLDPILNQFSDLGEQASNSGFTKALESIGKVIGEILFYIVAIGGALLGGPITAVVSIVTGLVGAIGSIFGRMEEGGKSLRDVFTNITSGIGQFFSTIGTFFSNIGGTISNVFSQIGPMILQSITFIPNTLLNLFSKGLDIGNILLNNLISGISKFSPFLSNIFGNIGGNIINSLGNIGGKIIESLTNISPFLGGLVSDFASNISQYFGGIIDIFKGIFTLDFGKVLEGGKKMATSIFNIFTTIPRFLLSLPTKLLDGILAIFPTLKDAFTNLPNVFVESFLSIGEKIRTFFEGLLPSWARGMLSGGKSDSSEVQETQQLSFAGSIDDGIVQDGNIVSTNPEDTLIATQEPQSLLSGFVGESPLGAIAGGLSNIVSGGAQSGMGNQQLIQKLDELKQAYMSNKDIYMDKEKVSSNVLKQNERSSENIFGLGFS